MIQRKQTLFLILSILIMIGYLFSPIVRLEGAGLLDHNIIAKEVQLNVNFPIIGRYFVQMCLAAAITTIIINLIIIFLYRYRKVQMVFCWLGVFSAAFAFCYAYYKWSTNDMVQDQIFYYGNILPCISIILMLTAWFFIKKDEELVRSVDRLR